MAQIPALVISTAAGVVVTPAAPIGCSQMVNKLFE
ncbi:hypothetical protein ACLK1S_11795 [Escherichia coli]